ncbi:protein mono-ADP-ribosyltransferase PARP16 isoform X1 [Echeneis naucrates]|uniref:protein mono-ADP-ribosyltransferase PARP16 isoform X1 n=1 Tax=Echeneis naucrates TaxID=173247 RepID=UPI001114045A|nr:protein mono-ADP-ribosyltransferase PARP16 isoform X1 [Echeneis naucrates]
MQPPLPPEAVRELVCSCLHRDPVAADLRCSLFVAAAQNYKRDSLLRPFPPRYISGDSKDFEELNSVFGEGTYLTSDLSMAVLYSPHSSGWRESLLGPLLSCVALCEVIDHPDVKCQVKKKDSELIDRQRSRAKNSEGGDVPQKYFVVTNNQLLRVKYLLVYSQRRHLSRHSRNNSWFLRHHFAVMMSLYLLLLILIGAFNSTTFVSFWNRLFR